MNLDMPDNIDGLPAQVERIEEKLDSLAASVDTRFASVDERLASVDQRFAEVDKRFDEVSEAIAEQRQYAEFAFDRLQRTMLEQFGDMRGYFQRLDRKLDLVVTAGLAAPRRVRAKKR